MVVVIRVFALTRHLSDRRIRALKKDREPAWGNPGLPHIKTSS